jgi:hypothetical protein
VTLAGAVYNPVALIAPTPAGLIVQITAVLLELLTLAVNCCVCPPESMAKDGVTDSTVQAEAMNLSV